MISNKFKYWKKSFEVCKGSKYHLMFWFDSFLLRSNSYYQPEEKKSATEDERGGQGKGNFKGPDKGKKGLKITSISWFVIPEM